MTKLRLKKNKGMTLISLVVTIIILIILAAVTIRLVLGDNGIINKAQIASDETTKEAAKEAMNFKITSAQIETYGKEQRMPTLQELADDFCEDEDFEYVELATKKTASLSKIEVGENESIFTKLKEYPYEFEINSSLQLASIDGIQVATGDMVTIPKEEYEMLKNNYSKLAGVFMSWKQVATWNEAGLSGWVQIDETMCTHTNDYNVTINESGKYLITMASYNTDGGGTPKFQLYQNETLVKEYTNNSTKNNITRTSVTLDLNEGDVFYGKIYGGGSNPTLFVTTFLKIAE